MVLSAEETVLRTAAASFRGLASIFACAARQTLDKPAAFCFHGGYMVMHQAAWASYYRYGWPIRPVGMPLR
jgi:hypothetical protein